MNAAPLPAPRHSSTTRRLDVLAALLTLLFFSPASSTANAAEAPGAAPVVTAPAATAAAPPVAPAVDKLKFTAAWRSRYEVWDFFAPSGGAGSNNTYDFYGTDLRASATWTDKFFEAMVEGQAVGLVDLPSNAVGTAAEGPLGLGAVYRANNGDQGDDGDIFLRQAWLKVKNFGIDGLTLKGGRQSFAEGKEVAAADPTLAWLQNMRIAERLIGPFDFTYPGRSFDSALGAWTKGALNLTGFYGKPTQGGFALDAMEEIDDIDVLYAALNFTQPERSKNSAARLFYLFYSDDRPLAQVDNRPLPARQADTADTAIHTLGAHALHVLPTSRGPVDVLGWFAWQTGQWGTLDQSSWALAVETGFQPSSLPWKPWFRLGYNASSGDDDPNDGDHGTFFQVMPTPRLYSLSTLYNLMNNQDAFAQVVLRPRPGLVWRTDLHIVRLMEDDDLWYFGGGATRDEEQAGYGYGGRPSGGKTGLMEVLETQVSYTWNDYVATTFYYGHGFGNDVVEADFRGDNVDYAFFEVTLKLPPR